MASAGAVLLASLFALVASFDPDHDRRIVGLVRDLEARYYISCTTVLFPDRIGEVHHRAFHLGKMMMTSHGSHGCVCVKAIGTYLEMFDGSQKQEKGCTRLFIVVLADQDADMRGDLIQLSRAITLEGTVWLICVNETANLLEFFAEVNAAYDMDMLAAQPKAGGEIRLFEVYRVTKDRPVRVREYGNWSDAHGLHSDASISFYSRRQDLEGIVLKVVLKHSPPNHVVRKRVGTGYHLKGLFGKIWRDMSRKLNFSSVYEVANKSGVLKANKEWSGLIGMMIRDEMDVGVGEVTMSPERCAVIHCLRPIVATRNQLYFKKTRLRLRWDAILKPFHSKTWVTIVFWFLISSASLNLFFRVSRRFHLEDDSVDFNFLNSVSTLYTAFCQQGSSMAPCSLSCRIVFFMSYIVATILFTVYSASLTSFIAAQQPFRPFENLQQLLQDGSYTLQTVRDSAAYVAFANATDTFNRRVFKQLIAVIPAWKLPKDKFEGLDRVCDNEKIVFFGTEYQTKRTVAEINMRGECEIISLERPLNLVYITMLLSKSSQFKNVFNYHLDAINYNGLLKRLIKKAWEEIDIVREVGFTGVGLTQVFQMYAILFLGIFLSALLFLTELMLHRSGRRAKNDADRKKL